MRCTVLTLVCLWVFAGSSVAQTNPIPAGQPFQVAFDHDGLNVTGFLCAVDGKPVLPDLPATARQCAIPSQPAGAHVVTVSAVNAFGTTVSPPLTATAGAPPSAPTNLRIVVQVAVQPSGDVTLLAASVSTDPPTP